MGDQREGGIAWTDETWNPIRGCTRVSPGCEHCYAEAVAARFSAPGLAYEGLAERRLFVLQDGTEELRGRWTGEVRMVPEHLADPLRWKRPRRVFVNSMSDLFHDRLTNEEIALVFAIMAASPQHTFQVLTKRPERMVQWFTWVALHGIGDGYQGPIGAMAHAVSCTPHPLPARVFGGEGDDGVAIGRALGDAWPLPNVWLGVTAEDQKRATERIPLLVRTPAARRFVSVEPQLEPVNIERALCSCPWPEDAMRTRHLLSCPADIRRPTDQRRWPIDWVITGAESGRGRRPYHLDWARSLRDQCTRAGAAFFFKQNVDALTGRKESTPELDGRRWTEFPGVA